MNYLNPFELLGAAVGGISKVVYDAPSDLVAGWDAAWDDNPAEPTPTAPVNKPTDEQIQAQIDKLNAMKSAPEPSTTTES